jgi:DNA repair protein RecO (recombination protein O)
VLQPGNTVRAVWRARLDEHLGGFSVELTELRSARLIGSAAALYALGSLAALVRLLPERDPHPDLFEAAGYLLDGLAEPAQGTALAVRFELLLLRDLGFGLDLTACAATGATEDLVYVSPKSGRAVSRAAGEPYKDRLLGLPPFLLDDEVEEAPAPEDLAAAFALTGHFLNVHAFAPRGQTLPEERERFVALSLGAPDGVARSDKLRDRFSPAREG